MSRHSEAAKEAGLSFAGFTSDLLKGGEDDAELRHRGERKSARTQGQRNRKKGPPRIQRNCRITIENDNRMSRLISVMSERMGRKVKQQDVMERGLEILLHQFERGEIKEW